MKYQVFQAVIPGTPPTYELMQEKINLWGEKSWVCIASDSDLDKILDRLSKLRPNRTLVCTYDL